MLPPILFHESFSLETSILGGGYTVVLTVVVLSVGMEAPFFMLVCDQPGGAFGNNLLGLLSCVVVEVIVEETGKGSEIPSY